MTTAFSSTTSEPCHQSHHHHHHVCNSQILLLAKMPSSYILSLVACTSPLKGTPKKFHQRPAAELITLAVAAQKPVGSIVSAKVLIQSCFPCKPIHTASYHGNIMTWLVGDSTGLFAINFFSEFGSSRSPAVTIMMSLAVSEMFVVAFSPVAERISKTLIPGKVQISHSMLLI